MKNNVKVKKVKKARIYIPVDPLNKDLEQFKIYQIDGVTYQVAIGKMATVPIALADRAMQIGDITDYDIVEE